MELEMKYEIDRELKTAIQLEIKSVIDWISILEIWGILIFSEWFQI